MLVVINVVSISKGRKKFYSESIFTKNASTNIDSRFYIHVYLPRYIHIYIYTEICTYLKDQNISAQNDRLNTYSFYLEIFEQCESQ